MDYLSVDLRLGEWNTRSRTGMAEVLYSPAGEGDRHPFALELDASSHVGRIQGGQEQAKVLGSKLIDSVFSPTNLRLWYESYQIARERGRGLRLRLQIDSLELTQLPWELMYDVDRGDFLVFDPIVSLVRYLRLHSMPPSLRQSQTLKILAVTASPQDQVQLDWQRELAVLWEALQELVKTGQVEIVPCERTTHEKLHDALLEHAPDVVHFIGHGTYDRQQSVGLLILEDDRGNSAPLTAAEATRMFRRYGVNLVILNACETARGAWAGLAPALVRAEIPAVVAMQWSIEDRAAIRFSRSFYHSLAMGKTIDECVAEGRIGASAGSTDPNDWAAPVLFLRSLSGQLWTSAADTRGRQELAPAPRPAAVVSGRPPGTALTPSAVERVHFQTWGPLSSDRDLDLIIERPELKRAHRLAQQPSVTHYIAFLGARQTGKTTSLLHLMRLLRDVFACVFIDLAVLRTQDALACFRFIVFRLISELRDRLPPGSFLPEPAIENSMDFLEFLRQLAESVPLPRIVILLDEIGALDPQASDAFFNTVRTLFTHGRGLNSTLSKYLFVFSGAVDLQNLTAGINSPLNICEKLYLHDFTLPDVKKIVGYFARLGVSVSPEAPQRAYDWAGGHPYLTMRLCAILESERVREVTAQQIDRAAEQILLEDDNIRYMIRELDRRPLERRRLRTILIEGRKLPFSRNDPVLASLEMIGAVRAGQPCEVRNRLYERALRQYYEQLEVAPQPTEGKPLQIQADEELKAAYDRLVTLHDEALNPDGTYRQGKAWEAFAAALFSMVQAFSIYPAVRPEKDQLNIVLAISGDAPGGSHWSLYQPAIWVECKDLRGVAPESIIEEAVADASAHNIKLVFIMTAGNTMSVEDVQAQYSGARGDICIVVLDDREIVDLLKERRDLDTFLRNKVLEARLRRI